MDYNRGEDPKWTTFGWQKIRPAALQRFHNSKYLTLCTVISHWIHGMLVGAFIPLSIRMLQQRFEMSRNEVSMITTTYESATITAIIVSSHKGNYGHKGQWLGGGMILSSLGALLWTVPQYMIGPHTFSDWTKNNIHCTESETSTAETIIRGNSYLKVDHSLTLHYVFLFIFLIAQVLIGVGSAPLAVLAPTYIDENLSHRKSPLYLGVMMANIAIGPLVGGALATVYMDIYGDIGKVDVEGLEINSDHPQWYGAWWLGFLTVGLLGLIISVPLLGFAKNLPTVDDERSEDVTQTADHVEIINDYTLTDIPAAIWSLLRNKTYSCVLGATMLAGALISATAINLPYLLKSYYSVSDNTAALISGFAVVIPQSLGAISGGFVLYHFFFKCRRIFQFCALLSLAVLIMVPSFLLYCGPPKIAGVTAGYFDKNFTGGIIDLENNCNKGCEPTCNKYRYHPVCDKSSQLSFYSPCFAGCRQEISDGVISVKGWTNCRCTSSSEKSGGTVSPGLCANTCGKFKLFIFMLILMGIASGMVLPGLQQGFLRTVGFEQRTMALSVGFVFSRLFGLVPGQFIMKNAMIQACSKRDPIRPPNCILPDNPKLGQVVTIYDTIILLGIIACFVTASFIYKTKPAAVQKEDQQEIIDEARTPNSLPEEDQV